MGNLPRFRVTCLTVGMFLMSTLARAEEIRGLIVRTLVLSEDTRLVGDVTCTVEGAPCIAFGAPDITLDRTAGPSPAWPMPQPGAAGPA